MDRHIGQYLAVQLDASRLESVHELAICGAQLPASRAYTYYPETTKVALTLSAVAVGMGPSVKQRFPGPLVIPVRRTLEPPGSQQDLLVPAMFGHAPFYSGQFKSPCARKKGCRGISAVRCFPVIVQPFLFQPLVNHP